MTDLTSGFNKNNAEILLKGIWYSELPPVLDMDLISEKIGDIFQLIDSRSCKFYIHNEYGRISDFKNIPKTMNRHGYGAEPIVFYDYKNNGTWREMQIPNFIYYLSFVYNTISVFDDLFEPLYAQNEKLKTDYSNSYLIFWDVFIESNIYNEVMEIDFKGQFTNRNIKKRSSIMFEENKKRYLKAESSYLFYLKLDIESFFPNIYSHLFDRMVNYEPYNMLSVKKDYFTFLDLFNRKINNDQTKGIPAGVFSSHISSELLMICIDFEIKKIIDELNVGYVRYVDDLTFFADTENELRVIQSHVQKVLNKYRLRINGNKTEIRKCIHSFNTTSIKDLYNKFPYLASEQEIPYEIRLDDLFEIKAYVSECLLMNKTSQVKTLLTRFNRLCNEGKITFCRFTGGRKELFIYCWKLIWADEKLAVHVYKLLDTLLLNMPEKEKRDNIDLLKGKTERIDCNWSDSIIQLWHYYIILKHDDEFKNMLINELDKHELNPIIIAMLTSEGNHDNGKLFKYIIERYKNEIGEEAANWKTSIIFSKWWLPILNIVIKDPHNYEGWVNSNTFPDILNVFKTHVDSKVIKECLA